MNLRLLNGVDWWSLTDLIWVHVLLSYSLTKSVKFKVHRQDFCYRCTSACFSVEKSTLFWHPVSTGRVYIALSTSTCLTTCTDLAWWIMFTGVRFNVFSGYTFCDYRIVFPVRIGYCKYEYGHKLQIKDDEMIQWMIEARQRGRQSAHIEGPTPSRLKDKNKLQRDLKPQRTKIDV